MTRKTWDYLREEEKKGERYNERADNGRFSVNNCCLYGFIYVLIMIEFGKRTENPTTNNQLNKKEQHSQF